MHTYTYIHHNDVKMGTIPSQITILVIVYSVVYSGTGESLNKGSVTRKMFPFDDVIMYKEQRDPHNDMQYVSSANSNTTCFFCFKVGACVL